MTRARWDRIDSKGYLDCAPALVVEVLSPSNTAAETNDRKKTFLAAGCREFRLADPILFASVPESGLSLIQVYTN
jgi:Uma2 family endonuclease